MRRSFTGCTGMWNALVVAGLLCGPGFSPEALAVAEEEPALAESAPARSGGRVARSAFTTAVVDREPTDTLEQLGNDVESVSYFTELRDLEGETVIHRWEFAGEVVTEVSFDVGATRWRVYSTKTLDPTRLGSWTVSVLDAHGNKLSEETLRYRAAGALPADGASPPAASEVDE